MEKNVKSARMRPTARGVSVLTCPNASPASSPAASRVNLTMRWISSSTAAARFPAPPVIARHTCSCAPQRERLIACAPFDAACQPLSPRLPPSRPPQGSSPHASFRVPTHAHRLRGSPATARWHHPSSILCPACAFHAPPPRNINEHMPLRARTAASAPAQYTWPASGRRAPLLGDP